MLNSFLIVLILAAFGMGTYFFFRKGSRSSNYSSYEVDNERYTLEAIVDYVNDTFNNILRTNLYELNLSKEEFQRRVRNKNNLRVALKHCTYGDLNSKNYVKDFIRDILVKQFGVREDNINNIINFNNPKELSIQDKFEICMYVYKKEHEYRALEVMIQEYELDNLRKKQDEEGEAYYICADDIEKIYSSIKMPDKFEDRLNVLVQRIYQMYKGYGVVDEIRDMKIDGVSGGVSGIPSTFFLKSDDDEIANLPTSCESIWIFFKGKTMHLTFLSFGNEIELKRICKNIYRYNNPGQLNETRGYMVNEMKDGSRIVVAMPPFCESWVFFVRKFDSAKAAKPEDLIKDKNNQLPINLIKWLIKGCRVTAVTGAQGTGKTTLLMSIVKFINPTFTLRIQEMAFELHLRMLYPSRNIVSFRETQTISGQDGLNLQKKTDGTVNILGEVATAPVASWMVQMAQVASLFTLFTHHAKTSSDLVLAIRNNLLQTGVFNNEKVAEKQVADVINFDVHLNNLGGHRYIERITEIIPLSQDIPYPEEYKYAKSHEEKIELFLDAAKEYFTRITDRKTFETRDIIRFIDGEYKVVNPLSKECAQAMMQFMSSEDKSMFEEFVKANWQAV